MSPKLKIFLDSDVIVSSLLSKTGAAYLLLNHKNLRFFISNFSLKELNLVIKKLNITQKSLNSLIKRKLKIIKLADNIEKLKKKFALYVADSNDAHIVAGAVAAEARFLVTYNLKHYHDEKIKAEFGLILLTPARLLQYLRNH